MNVELKDFLAIVGLFFTLVALFKGIIEYQKAQKWKKLEFLAKEIKEFLNDYNVKRMFLLLDWNIIDIPIRDGELESTAKKVIIDDSNLAIAWQHHSNTLNGFPEKETLIRHIFDDSLTKLSLFNQYIKTGLMTKEDLKPYLIYWIDIIGRKEKGRKAPQVINQLWEYIDKYGYTDIQELCGYYNYDITKTE